MNTFNLSRQIDPHEANKLKGIQIIEIYMEVFTILGAVKELDNHFQNGAT